MCWCEKDQRELLNEISAEHKKEVAKLHAELEEAKRQIAIAREAPKNGCLKGQYCRYCKHSVLIPEWDGDKCVCTYGTCPHFENE